MVEIMTDVLDVLESMHVVRDIRHGDLQVLEIDSRLAGYDMHVLQLIEHDDAGLVSRVTLFMRPLPGVANLAAHLGPRLVRRRWGPIVAALIAPPMYLVALLLRLTDRLSPRFV